jgi:hypothetical protein
MLRTTLLQVFAMMFSMLFTNMVQGGSYNGVDLHSYPMTSRIVGKSPVIIYLAIDSPEPFMQISIDHEVYELKQLCVRNPQTKAVILISSQLGKSIQRGEKPRIEYCDSGKLQYREIELPKVKELIENIKSPLSNYLILKTVLEYVTSPQLPFANQGFLLQLKSHGFKQNIATYINEIVLSERIEDQKSILSSKNIKWQNQVNDTIGDGHLNSAFNLVKEYLNGSQEIKYRSNFLGERIALNAGISEPNGSYRLSEDDFTKIIESLENQGRIFAFLFIESCRGSSYDDAYNIPKYDLTWKFRGFVYRANGSLSYHNFDWSDLAKYIQNGSDLFFAMMAKVFEFQNRYPDDDIFRDIMTDNLEAFRDKLSRNIGKSSDFFKGKPLIWFLLRQQKMNFFNAFIELNPDFIADLYHKSAYDLFRDCLDSHFSKNPLAIETFKKIYKLQKRNDTYNINDILQLLNMPFFYKINKNNKVLLDFLLEEFRISSQTLFEAKPLDSFRSLKLNLLELCILNSCQFGAKQALVQIGFKFRNTEDTDWVRLLTFDGSLAGMKAVLAKFGNRLNRAQISELAGLLQFDGNNLGSLMQYHTKIKYLFGKLNADFYSTPFFKDWGWHVKSPQEYFQHLVYFFGRFANELHLDKSSIESYLWSIYQNSKYVKMQEAVKADNTYVDELFDWVIDPFIDTQFEFLRDAFYSENLEVFEKFNCLEKAGWDTSNCGNLLKILTNQISINLRNYSLESNDSNLESSYSVDPELNSVSRTWLHFLNSLKYVLEKKGFVFEENRSDKLTDFSDLEDTLVRLKTDPKQGDQAVQKYLNYFFENESFLFGLSMNGWPDFGKANPLILEYIFSGKNKRVTDQLKMILKEKFYYQHIPISKYFVKFIIRQGSQLLQKADLFDLITYFIGIIQLYGPNDKKPWWSVSEDLINQLFKTYHELGVALKRITPANVSILDEVFTAHDEANRKKAFDGIRFSDSSLVNLILCKNKTQGKLAEGISDNYLNLELELLDVVLTDNNDKKLSDLPIDSSNRLMGKLGFQQFACLFNDVRTQAIPENYYIIFSKNNIGVIKNELFDSWQSGSADDWQVQNDRLMAFSKFQQKIFEQLIEKAKMLIQHDPKIISMRDDRGRTFLHWAAYFGNWAIIRALLESGADANAIDLAGKTVLDLFFDGKNLSYDVLLLLRDYNFDFVTTSKIDGKLSYLNLLRQLPLAEIDKFSLIKPYMPKESPKEYELRKSYDGIRSLRNADLQEQYYRTLIFLRLYK